MQNQSENAADQSKISVVGATENLKRKIAFTNSQLHQILNNSDQFASRIKMLNQNAIRQIKQQNFQDAIIYLSEAQKNLEYAASCGLSIDRVLITTILKNQACAYQKLWELGTSYDYLQALIYNLDGSTDSPEINFLNQQLLDNKSETSKNLNQVLNNKMNLALCYVQFSALSSQLGKHDQARTYVEKSLKQFQILCELCHSYEKKVKGKTSVLLDEVKSSALFDTNVKAQKVLNQCKKGLNKIKNHRYFFSFDEKLIQKMSMGDIMQIQYLSFQQATKKKQTEWFTSQLGLTYLSIFISCCFFALATQIRLGSQQQFNGGQQHQKQMMQAKLYHLHSIRMATNLVLIQSNFLNHILKSFKTNFNIDIMAQKLPQKVQQFEQLSQIRTNEQKNQQIQINYQQRKNNSPQRRTDDQVTTKFHTVQSDLNSNPDKNQHKNLTQTKKQFRKVSIVQTKSGAKKQSKKNLLQQFGVQKKRSNSKDPTKFKNIRNKQKKLISVNKKILNNQYFSKMQNNNKKVDKNIHKATSPKSKIPIKSEKSRSRSKLKLNTLKSPKKL